ncbi:MAG: peptidyl-prolyl cis-trans isomerase [Candidatus Eisenbacteria bacterium]|uniref:peptidylprolyl isomerase n=1 Tax=Eiseniibacteriota bacterium TaxID=2212470 RepID=A0A937X7D5_UNCEI|nr:peptidyl-prolyl cis-trans isomerase [Candidatus Eisenbacteria bacterium]
MRAPRDPFLRRAIARLAAGVLALCGFTCGAGAQISGKPDFTAPDLPGGELVVLEIAGEKITAAEVYHKVRLQYPQMPSSGPALGKQAAEMVKQMVNEGCFARLGEERGYERVADVSRLLYLSRSFILSNAAMRRDVWDTVSPSDEEIEGFYAQDPERFLVRGKAWYHEILVGDEALARDLRARLVAGADFGELAAQHSIDPNAAARRGEMPPADKGAAGGRLAGLPEVERLLFEIEPLAISEPLRTERGWHILRVDNRREERHRSLEEVREEVRENLATKRENARYQAVLDSLATVYAVEVHDDALELFHFLQLDDAELFENARGEKEAGRRLRMYEHLIDRFPGSPRRPEALFMIAFETAEKIGDERGGVEAFERFLDEYPSHEMSAAARVMLSELRRKTGERP